MPLKIFISSEMDTNQDKKRREATIKEIRELNHVPIVFEELPARALPEDKDALDKCEELVRESDIIIVIVDDTVSEGMQIEIEEAVKTLGMKRMFFYFTSKGKRDVDARKLWEIAKEGHIAGTFNSPSHLRKEIKRSIGSYFEDTIKTQRGAVRTKEFPVTLKPGTQFYKRMELEKGDTVIITCIGNAFFYAGFFPRAEYMKIRGQLIQYPLESQRREFTGKIEIQETDDYYLDLIRSVLVDTPVTIRVKIQIIKGN